MVKPISLSVHKNTLEQHRRHLCRKRMIGAAKSLSMSAQNVGFYIVAWDMDGFYTVKCSDPQKIVGANNLPGFVAGSATRYVAELDRKDDD